MRRHQSIYLDYNATTPCAPEVVQSMLPFLSSLFGNPASTHAMGREAHRAVESARAQVAMAVGSQPDEIVFTSGATEGNWIALMAFGRQHSAKQTRVLVGAAEHKSVLANRDVLLSKGISLEIIPVDKAGVVDLDSLSEQLGPDVSVVSVHAANNEVGSIQPVAEIARMAHEVGAVMHCDAAQAVGKIPFSVENTDVDLATFSAHKVYGPKGVGALAVRHGLRNRCVPPMAGGGQEGGIRPGTVNVPGIVGMGVAFEVASSVLEDDAARVRRLRDTFETGLIAGIVDARINGPQHNRLPGTVSVTIPGLPSDVVVAAVSPVCVSSGSACTSGSIGPSHVLLAMGMSREDADCTIRVSLGRYTTHDEVAAAINIVVRAVHEARAQLA